MENLYDKVRDYVLRRLGEVFPTSFFNVHIYNDEERKGINVYGRFSIYDVLLFLKLEGFNTEMFSDIVAYFADRVIVLVENHNNPDTLYRSGYGALFCKPNSQIKQAKFEVFLHLFRYLLDEYNGKLYKEYEKIIKGAEYAD